MMVRKPAVDLAEQFAHRAPHAAVQFGGERPWNSVAAVDDDSHRPRQLHIAENALQIALANIHLAVSAVAGCEYFAFDALPQLLDGLTGKRLAGDHHLQSVVVRRIVTAGDHDAGAGLQFVRREIQHGRGHTSDVDHVDAASLQATTERLGQVGAGKASVASDDHLGLGEGASLRADGAPDQLGCRWR